MLARSTYRRAKLGNYVPRTRTYLTLNKPNDALERLWANVRTLSTTLLFPFLSFPPSLSSLSFLTVNLRCNPARGLVPPPLFTRIAVSFLNPFSLPFFIQYPLSIFYRRPPSLRNISRLRRLAGRLYSHFHGKQSANTNFIPAHLASTSSRNTSSRHFYVRITFILHSTLKNRHLTRRDYPTCGHHFTRNFGIAPHFRLTRNTRLHLCGTIFWVDEKNWL